MMEKNVENWFELKVESGLGFSLRLKLGSFSLPFVMSLTVEIGR